MIQVIESTEMTIKEFCQKLEDIYYQKFPNSWSLARLVTKSPKPYPFVLVGGLLANEEEYRNFQKNGTWYWSDFGKTVTVYDVFNVGMNFDFIDQENLSDDSIVPASFTIHYLNAEIMTALNKNEKDFFLKHYKLNSKKKLKTKPDTVGDVNKALKEWSILVDNLYKAAIKIYNDNEFPENAYKFIDIDSKF